MYRGRRRRLAGIGCAAVLASAIAAAGAAAHPFSSWTGTSGPFRWQAKRLSCGDATGEPNRLAAHSRWITSRRNGYQRLTFTRQIRDADTLAWATVQRQRRSTKNTRLEGARTTLHWSQFFTVPDGDAGETARNQFRFEWKRDRVGPDPTLFSVTVTSRTCIVGD